MAGKSININPPKPNTKGSTTTATSSKSTTGQAKSVSSSAATKEEPTTSYIVRPSPITSGLKIYANSSVLNAHFLVHGDLVRIWKADAISSLACAVGQIFGDDDVGGQANVLQLSASIRGVIGVLLGDRVKLERYRGLVGEAAEVSVIINSDDKPDQIDELVKTTLRDIKFICRNHIVTPQTGPAFRIYDIESSASNARPAGLPYFHRITPSTKFNILPESPSPSSTPYLSSIYSPASASYSQLGGLTKEIVEIRKTIELPLQRPEIYTRFRVPPPRGLLLHGPSGTGKTALLRAIAHETDSAHILTISPSAILGKYLGDTESALRKIFDEARTFAPSVILVDEIDALAPRRDADVSGETEARIVSTLVTLFDSLRDDPDARVVVVAATNRLANVEPALRQVGRLEKDVELRIPDITARGEILSLQLNGMPHSLAEIDINSTASKTHGFVGADLVALCREAVMCAVARGDGAGERVDEMQVLPSDFTTAMLSVRASAMREIFLETPKVYWTDIGGQEEIKQKLKEVVEWPLTHPESFKRLGITPPRGILLYGPPGCSKTLTAKALATEAGLNFLAVKGPEIFNKYVGESEKSIREIFRKARNASPSIIFFDEIDAISAARGHAEVGGDRVLTSMLNEMDGIESMGNVIVLAATNRPEIIDPALLRPGRIDRMLYVCPPDFEARKKILEVRFKSMSISDGVDINDLANNTDGCSGAEITSLCQEAGLQAMNEDLNSQAIESRHFQKALKGLNRSITKEMTTFYEGFKAGIAKV
ncbi:P-loop containing nucleoside triphosphate hydrolase protein [Lipomyces japonicus]|uniref:P-loop containing nucleoside triphosphate hydrolase protein n=1 Tax=Lipomyces japonicus TaxID=56871 RepID=UPI0034CD3400